MFQESYKSDSFSMRNIGLVLLFILIAVGSRFVPHAFNFTPIGAMAIFGAAYIRQTRLAFILPLITLWLSDLVLNNIFYPQYFQGFSWYGDWSVYVAFILNIIIGRVVLFEKVKFMPLVLTSLGTSVVFYLITNIWSAFTLPIYSKDITGVMASLTAGLPFFKTSVVGDLVFCLVMFGAFQFVSSKVFKLNVERA